MPGNATPPGARRNPGSKKGPTSGSGGRNRKGLQGKGPTPKASERVGHPASRRGGSSSQRSSSGRSGAKPRGSRSGQETIAGRNSVVEALRAGVPATTLLLAERIDHDGRVREALALAAEQHLPVLEAPKAELDRLTDGAVHQGIGLTVPPYDYAHPGDLLGAPGDAPPLVVALDGVTDPRNLGGIVRSAAAFGASGVVVPERRAAGMTASAWKTSAGAAARIRVARATNLARTLGSYREAGLFVVGLAAEGEETVGALSLAQGPLVLVVGSEGKGLSRIVREQCDVLASIPMSGGNESLNASVAAGIALYAVDARRRA